LDIPKIKLLPLPMPAVTTPIATVTGKIPIRCRRGLIHPAASVAMAAMDFSLAVVLPIISMVALEIPVGLVNPPQNWTSLSNRPSRTSPEK